MKPDPEHLVALALSGALPLDQAVEILASVEFKGSRTMTVLGWENALNDLAKRCREKRAADRAKA